MLSDNLLTEVVLYLPFHELKHFNKNVVLKILSLSASSQYLAEFEIPDLHFAEGIITSIPSLQIEKLSSLRLLTSGETKILVSLNSNVGLNRYNFLLLLEDFVARQKLQEEVAEVGTRVISVINPINTSLHRFLGYRYDFNDQRVLKTYQQVNKITIKSYDWEFEKYIYSGQIFLGVEIEKLPLPEKAREDLLLLSINPNNKIFREFYLLMSHQHTRINVISNQIAELQITLEDFLEFYSQVPFLFKLLPKKPDVISREQLPVLAENGLPITVGEVDIYVYFNY